MGETIVLPKSGLEIPWRDYHGRKAALRACGYDFAQIRETASPGLWQCQWADTIRTGTREECIDWLDAQALETRAALTPPGHVLVGPDARETVARARCDLRLDRLCTTLGRRRSLIAARRAVTQMFEEGMYVVTNGQSYKIKTVTSIGMGCLKYWLRRYRWRLRNGV